MAGSTTSAKAITEIAAKMAQDLLIAAMLNKKPKPADIRYHS